MRGKDVEDKTVCYEARMLSGSYVQRVLSSFTKSRYVQAKMDTPRRHDCVVMLQFGSYYINPSRGRWSLAAVTGFPRLAHAGLALQGFRLPLFSPALPSQEHPATARVHPAAPCCGA